MEKELDKYDLYLIVSKQLIENGFSKKYFAYQVGNFENENGDDIFIKGDIVLTWHYSMDVWFLGSYSKFNYKYCIDAEKVFNINTYLK
jgi:hypothetical protein